MGIVLLAVMLCVVGSSCKRWVNLKANNSFNPNNGPSIQAVLMLPAAWTPTPFTPVQTARPLFESSNIPIGAILPPAPQPKDENYLVIGYSVQGRALEVYRFGNGARNLMIIAGIHGGYEYNTIELADELIELLEHHPEIIPPQVHLHILRNFNPDGAARSRGPLGRGNAHGVDLNRNWNASWQVDGQGPGCWSLVPLTAGSHPGSEPETKALMRYLIEADIKALINYHSAALGIFPGGNPPIPNSVALAQALAAISDYPYPPIDIGCDYSGTLVDWASATGIAAVDLELSTHWDTDFQENLQILIQFLAWRPERP